MGAWFQPEGHAPPGCCAERAALLVPYIQGMGLRRQKVCARKKNEVQVLLQGNVIQEQMMDKVWTGKGSPLLSALSFETSTLYFFALWC